MIPHLRCTCARGVTMPRQVGFQWKNPDFLLKNPDFLLKNVDFYNKTGGRGVMASHNMINWIPCHANKKMLTEILRDRFGLENGYLVYLLRGICIHNKSHNLPLIWV